MHYFIRYAGCVSQWWLGISRIEAVACLIYDLSLILDWFRKNLVIFNISEVKFFHLSTFYNFLDDYPLYFDNAQLIPSFILSIMLPSLQILLGKITLHLLPKLLHRSYICCVDSVITLLLRSRCLYRNLNHSFIEYGSQVWSGYRLTDFLNRVETKAFRLISSLFHTYSLQLSFFATMLHHSLFYYDYAGYWSSELSQDIFPLFMRARNIHQATFSHPFFSVYLFNAEIIKYSQSYIYTAGQLWIILLSSINQQRKLQPRVSIKRSRVN